MDPATRAAVAVSERTRRAVVEAATRPARSPALRRVRALLALIETGDADHFLRVYGISGEDALVVDWLLDHPLPAEAVAQAASEAGFDGATEWEEIEDWAEARAAAAYEVVEALDHRRRESAIRALARGVEPPDDLLDELSPAELFWLLSTEELPRGTSRRSAAEYQRVQTLRKRLRRRAATSS